MSSRYETPPRLLWGLERPCEHCEGVVVFTRTGWVHKETLEPLAPDADPGPDPDEVPYHHAQPRLPEASHDPAP